MQATLWFYIIVGLLTVVPLILFNINRVFVRKKPNPMKINWIRGIVILLLSAIIIVFLCSAYNATLHQRYEIALERAATAHAETLLGKQDTEAFKNFLRENGTENIEESLKTLELGSLPIDNEIRFQLGNQCTPKYWTEWDDMVSYKGLIEEGLALDLTVYTEESATLFKAALKGALLESVSDEAVLTCAEDMVTAFIGLTDGSSEVSFSDDEKAAFEEALSVMPDLYIWNNQDVITVTDMQANPVYLMYRLVYDGGTQYYAVRMVKTEKGWLYDWFGVPNEQQQQSIKMPTEKNGKWYSVHR